MKRKNVFIALLFFVVTFCTSCNDLFSSLYFTLATSISEPTPMKLYLPKDTDKEKIVVDDKTFTVLLFNSGKTYVYEGNDLLKEVIIKCENAKGCLRKKLIFGKNKFKDDFKVVIKPSNNCEYKDVVDILDEMSINSIKKYTLTDITKQEETMYKNAQ